MTDCLIIFFSPKHGSLSNQLREREYDFDEEVIKEFQEDVDNLNARKSYLPEYVFNKISQGIFNKIKAHVTGGKINIAA